MTNLFICGTLLFCFLRGNYWKEYAPESSSFLPGWWHWFPEPAHVVNEYWTNTIAMTKQELSPSHGKFPGRRGRRSGGACSPVGRLGQGWEPEEVLVQRSRWRPIDLGKAVCCLVLSLHIWWSHAFGMSTNLTIVPPLTWLCLMEDLSGVQVAINEANSTSNYKHLKIFHCNALKWRIRMNSRICRLRPWFCHRHAADDSFSEMASLPQIQMHHTWEEKVGQFL